MEQLQQCTAAAAAAASIHGMQHPRARAVGTEEDRLGVVVRQDLEVDNLGVQVAVKLHRQLGHVVAAHLLCAAASGNHQDGGGAGE